MKRFTATEKWAKAWYRELSLKHKCLWQFLCDNCDSAGLWEPDFGLATFQIGERVSDSDVEVFGDRVVLLESGKYWLTGFINFQCGELSTDCFPHKAILKLLEKHGLTEIYKDPTRVVGRVGTTLQDKEKDKDKDKEGGMQGGDKKVAASVGGAFKKPTLEEIKLQCAKIGLAEIEAQRFFNHYESNGWKVGRNPMRSWTAALSNWKLNAKNYANQHTNSQGTRKLTGAEQRKVGIPEREADYDLDDLLKKQSQKRMAEKAARDGVSAGGANVG